MKRNICLTFFLSVSLHAFSQLPAYTITVFDSSATKGYYFLSNGNYLMILDKYGELVYYKPGVRYIDFMLQPNGLMSYNTFPPFYFMDSTFRVVDSLICKHGILTDNHDLRILPNGHFLMLGLDSVRMDLSGFPYWRQKLGRDTGKVNFTVVQELDTGKKVVFEWRAIDHFAIADMDTFFLIKPPLFDWTHADAVEMDDDGNILLCNRNFNEITKINRSNGAVMWRLGGRRNQFTFVNCPVPFYGQHDIRRISNGHITLFDDGEHPISHGARAMEFELDEQKKIAILKWSYTNDSTMHSTRQGNVQRLANSNTLVNYGFTAGNPNNPVGFVVINTADSIIFQLNGINSYRVLNYPTLPWQLHRPLITCFDSAGIKYLRTEKSYASYRWSDSSTSRIIAVTKPGSYIVFVPYGEEGFLSSEKFIVTDISLPCRVQRKLRVKRNK